MKLLKVLLLFLSPIYAHTDIEVFIGNPVNIQWQEYGQEYEYMLKIFRLRDGEEIHMHTSNWIDENSLDLEIQEESSYRWELYIREDGKTCDDDYQCIHLETGYFDFYFPIEEIEQPPEEPEIPEEGDEEVETVVEETPPAKEIISKESKEKVIKEKKKVLGTSTSVTTNKYIPKEDIENVKETAEIIDDEQETIVRENSCNYTFSVEKGEFTFNGCKIKNPEIRSSTYYKYNDSYVFKNTGTCEDSIRIYIENTVCKNFDLFEPRTWFGCVPVITGGDEYTPDLNHEVYFFDGDSINPSSFVFDKNKYEIIGVHNQLPNQILYKGYFSVRHRGNWLDEELATKLSTQFEEKENKGSAIYDFPFSKIVYVNQWHGCTKYSCPHRGIDFAVAKEKIYASEDGVVVAKGYDTYYGECNSGGNYLLVEYENGNHMSYMHLEKSYVKNGQKVKRGDLLALSGKSGSNNCQPLGYHLHFELRKKRPQSTHIDPVPYIDVDWSLVKTNKSNIFPKRLSGNNPHPKY
jgi:murein DD-endopeptidase MepM/ murein hydrolase activator NlpD